MAEITRFTPYDDLPEWLSVEEYQTYVHVGRTAAYDVIRSGKYPILKVGRIVRVHKTAVKPERVS